MLKTGNDGYGVGWRLPTSQFDLERRLLTLASGETHLAEPLPPAGHDVVLKDLKLKTVRVVRPDSLSIAVYSIDGTIEILRRPSPSDIYRTASVMFENGEAFDYRYTAAGGLAGVRARSFDKDILTLEYKSGVLSRVRTRVQDERIAEMAFVSANGFITSVTVPYDNTNGDADPDAQPKYIYSYQKFGADFVGVAKVVNPMGGIDVVDYAEAGLRYYQQASLPTAVRLQRIAGAGQPDVVVRYRYSQDRNFTGYPFNDGFQAGTDNLYRTVGAYKYWGEQTIRNPDDGDKVIERTTCTFNKFHLMSQQEIQRGAARIVEDYEYNEQPGKMFSAQPANLQVPRKMTAMFVSDTTGDSRTETVTMESDDYGNVLSNIEPSGAPHRIRILSA